VGYRARERSCIGDIHHNNSTLLVPLTTLPGHTMRKHPLHLQDALQLLKSILWQSSCIKARAAAASTIYIIKVYRLGYGTPTPLLLLFFFLFVPLSQVTAMCVAASKKEMDEYDELRENF